MDGKRLAGMCVKIIELARKRCGDAVAEELQAALLPDLGALCEEAQKEAEAQSALVRWLDACEYGWRPAERKALERRWLAAGLRAQHNIVVHWLRNKRRVLFLRAQEEGLVNDEAATG